jgi:hypothetical protein
MEKLTFQKLLSQAGCNACENGFLTSACKSGWPVVFVSDKVIILCLETKGNIYLLIYAIKTCQISKNSFVLLPGVVWSIIKP